ncbi:MAG: hypothetical protein DRN29_06350 [Thermoplasmata archaeon]|nr:MAG: hypothetical protein DRN29_06350 [Thermoplasmata archaeon]
MNKMVVIGIICMLFVISMPVDNSEVDFIVTGRNAVIDGNNDGKTLYVGGGGPNNYTSIQDAINDAKDEDTVFVYSGVYNESIILDKSINLIGEHREKTIIYAAQGYAINVTGSHVTINNFAITNGSWEYASVIVYNSEGNTISNCNFYNNDCAIRIYSSYKNKILDCDMYGNLIGIQLRYSKDNEILNCNVSHNGEGMSITYSDGNKVSQCIFYENKWGGISIDYSLSNTILNNVFVDNGIGIYGEKLPQFIHNIYNNTVNGLPLLYIRNEKNVVLKDIEAGEVIIVNCNVSKIKNIAINNSYIGIEVAYCNNNIITDCTISNTYEGILLFFSSHNVLSNNSISNSNESGISLNTCDNNAIIGNRVTNTYGNAIFLWDSCYNNISSNEINENGMGILVFSYSDHNTVYRNNVVKNDFYGISIQGGSFNEITHNVVCWSKYWCGISTAKSWTCGNIISKNEVLYNNWVGIEIEGVGNIICNNNISYNTQCGIYLSSFLGIDCKQNVIKENNLIENGMNAYFDVKLLSLNLWFKNYWSDWHSFFPKPIHGDCIIISMPMSRIRVPWLNFDWMPSTKPYKW